MWGPAQTADTEMDVISDEASGGRSVAAMIGLTLCLGAVVSFAGYAIAKTGIAMAANLGLSEGLVGALFTSVATSTPELVTTITAVRRGALTLAVGGILGGNTFDVLFTAFSDIAYREGSIYHSMQDEQLYLIILTTVMTGVLLLGLLRRERHGMANIGFESVGLLLVYVGGIAILATGFPA
jgi:cation:H+ antiporter